MGNALQHKTVVVVGRGSAIARAVTLRARSEGARVVAAGREKDKLAGAYDDPGISAEMVDVTDDMSIASLAERVGSFDHVVSTASARARENWRIWNARTCSCRLIPRSSDRPCWPSILRPR